jgi:transmembrane sensor
MNSFHQIPDPAAEEQAALWAARLEGSALDAADHAALEAWLAENPVHRTLLSQYCQFSADLEEQLPMLVAAGAVAMPVPPPGGGPQGKMTARRGRNFKWIARATLAAAALVMLAFWFTRPERQSGNFATAAAQRQTITLVDGTRVELNARTSLQVEIGRTERHVRMAAGEAFFTVSKDPARPFIVETPAGSVRVTGTIFNVHTESPSALNVTVVEGSVLVRPDEMSGARAADSVSLHVGDWLRVGPGSVSKQTLSASELEDALAWRQGYIVFDHVPLSEALARFAYYLGRGGLTTSSAAGARHVSGRYSLDDLDGFLATIEDPATMMNMRVTPGPDGSRRVSLRNEP